MTNAHKRAVR